jgi:lysophospholipase L1-like esterase
MTGRWVQSWASVPQLAAPGDLPPEPFCRNGRALADATLRQTVRASLGGRRMRLRLSNTYGDAPLAVTAMSVAAPAAGRAGVSAIEAGTAAPVTFHGNASVAVPIGADVFSDPVEFDLSGGANLAVTLYLARGCDAAHLTAHPGSRTTSYVVTGERSADVDLPGALGLDHWYLLSGLEIWSDVAAAAVMLGDSLTDGRGSTTNGNDRWPDRLLQRLHADPATADVAVVNQGVGGNRVLADGIGLRALDRLDRDILTLSTVDWLLLFEGGNDIGTAPATVGAQDDVVADLISAYHQLAGQAQSRGMRVYAATLTPFGGNDGYDDPGGLRDAARGAVNDWIRSSGRFDAVVDFDRAVRDPVRPARLLPDFDGGDHLHLNPRGYQALAEAVPLRLFLGSNKGVA